MEAVVGSDQNDENQASKFSLSDESLWICLCCLWGRAPCMSFDANSRIGTAEWWLRGSISPSPLRKEKRSVLTGCDSLLLLSKKRRQTRWTLLSKSLPPLFPHWLLFLMHNAALHALHISPAPFRSTAQPLIFAFNLRETIMVALGANLPTSLAKCDKIAWAMRNRPSMCTIYCIQTVLYGAVPLPLDWTAEQCFNRHSDRSKNIY